MWQKRENTQKYKFMFISSPSARDKNLENFKISLLAYAKSLVSLVPKFHLKNHQNNKGVVIANFSEIA